MTFEWLKKKVIVDHAKKIVQDWATRTISEGDKMLKDVYDASKPATYGKLEKHSWPAARGYSTLPG